MSDDDLKDVRWHVPQVALRRDGRWGVFCASCSHHRGDYVDRCLVFPHLGRDWPPPILVPAKFGDGTYREE